MIVRPGACQNTLWEYTCKQQALPKIEPLRCSPGECKCLERDVGGILDKNVVLVMADRS